jgi:hypothetical protein
MIFQANRIQKQAGIAIPIYDKADFKPKLLRQNKQGHYILRKGTIYQRGITIIYIYRYMKQRDTNRKGSQIIPICR